MCFKTVISIWTPQFAFQISGNNLKKKKNTTGAHIYENIINA